MTVSHEVLTSEEGVIDVLQADGRLDAEAAPALESELDVALNSGHNRVVLDLSSATYISSSALKVLVAAWRRARAHGGDLILAGLHPRVREIFEMVGFDRIFTIRETAKQAIAVLGEARR
jgi:anti-sigma B factor antagonist